MVFPEPAGWWSITDKFTQFERKLTFSFDPEKTRLIQPPRKGIAIQKP
jgi:hypothetical protein